MYLHKRSKKGHVFLLFLVCVVLIWSVIKPTSYSTWAAESIPAIVGIIIVVSIYTKYRFTTLSYFIMSILVITMFIGGHYTYSEVPFFNWLKDTFELSRNHYDRLGHFLKGSFVIVIREILLRQTYLRRDLWLAFICISISLAIAALYEIIEWISYELTKSEEISKNFLGMQGDPWDAQWDMSLTLIGSIVTLLLLSYLHNRYLKFVKSKEYSFK